MIRNAIQRFMYGRYGIDQLNICLFLVCSALILLFAAAGFELFYGLGVVVLALALFRMLSRNLPRRRAENAKFLEKAGPLFRWLRLQRTIHKDKEHRYFQCPSCGQHLRVPRGKGKITVSCRSCGASFQEKS